jgi:hypothetical protein
MNLFCVCVKFRYAKRIKHSATFRIHRLHIFLANPLCCPRYQNSYSLVARKVSRARRSLSRKNFAVRRNQMIDHSIISHLIQSIRESNTGNSLLQYANTALRLTTAISALVSVLKSRHHAYVVKSFRKLLGSNEDRGYEQVLISNWRADHKRK